MNPQGRLLYVDRLATEFSVGYRNMDYIADALAPLVPIGVRSGVYAALKMSDWFRNAAQPRGQASRSVGFGFDTDNTGSFYCNKYSFRWEVDDDSRAVAQSPYDVDMLGTRFVTDKLQLKREVSWGTGLFTTGVWGTDKVGATDFSYWDDYGGSDPAVDIEAWKDAVELKSGATPDTAAMGRGAWTYVKFHPSLIDKIKYTQRGQVAPDLAAELFELRKLNIGKAIYTTSPRGTAESSVTYSRVWGRSFWLGVVPTAPGLFIPAATYSLFWNRPGAPVGVPQYIRRIRDEERETDIFESNSYFTQKVMAATAALFASNVINPTT